MQHSGHCCLTAFCTYLEALDRSERTIQEYRKRLEKFIQFAGDNGVTDLDGLTPEIIDRFVVKCKHSGISTATLAGYIQAVKCFLAWCARRRYIETNPADHLRKPKIDYGARIKAMSSDDLAKLIRAADLSGNARLVAVLYILADTGCRIGELLNLDMEGLHLDILEAHTSGKTGWAVLDYTETTAAAIRAYLTVRLPTDNRAVFTNEWGRCSYHTIYRDLRILAGLLGIERFNPHSIRHMVGQSWIDQDANLEMVRLKLRHSDITTTSRFYANQDRSRIKAASQRFSVVRKLGKS
jgi:integrase/recombinase XerD